MTQLEKDVQKLTEAFRCDWLDKAVAQMRSMNPYPDKEQRIKILAEEKEKAKNGPY